MADQKKSIGYLYKHTTQDGKKKYLKGKVTIDGKSVPIVCWVNEKKTEEKHPDLRIYEDQPKPSGDRANNEMEPF